MTRYIRTFLLAVVAVAGMHGYVSAISPSEAFANAPRRIFPLLDRNTRLDMLDYFKSGLDTESKNALNGGSTVTAMTEQAIAVQLTDASRADLVLLPAASDTLIAVITTVNTPAPDSKITIYSRDWTQNLTTSKFSKPELKAWLTPAGVKNADQVHSFVPFLLISYSYDPSTSTLTLTNNTRLFLSDDIYAIVEPYLLPQLTYRWNGKRFTLIK